MPKELTGPYVRHLPLWLTPQHKLTLRFAHLYHVGALDGSQQRNGDLEGPLLSASLKPEEWRRFGNLGDSPCWKVSKDSGQLHLLDVNRWQWHKQLQQQAHEWAFSTGLIERNAKSGYTMAPPLQHFWHQRQNTYWTMGNTKQLETATLGVALLILHKAGKPAYDGLWWETSTSPLGSILSPRAGLIPADNLHYQVV